MQAFALGVAPKHDADFQLLKSYYQCFENREYREYLERHLERYTSYPDGIFVGISYNDAD